MKESLTLLEMVLIGGGGLVGLVLGIVLGGLILMAACAFCNVENLRFVKALGLVVLLGLVNGLIGLGLFFGIGVVGYALGLRAEASQILFGLVAIPVNLLVSASILWLLLPTGYGRGLLIALMNAGLTLILVGVVGGLTLVTLAGMQIATVH
jgi:hypothetical protein